MDNNKEREKKKDFDGKMLRVLRRIRETQLRIGTESEFLRGGDQSEFRIARQTKRKLIFVFKVILIFANQD